MGTGSGPPSLKSSTGHDLFLAQFFPIFFCALLTSSMLKQTLQDTNPCQLGMGFSSVCCCPHAWARQAAGQPRRSARFPALRRLEHAIQLVPSWHQLSSACRLARASPARAEITFPAFARVVRLRPVRLATLSRASPFTLPAKLAGCLSVRVPCRSFASDGVLSRFVQHLLQFNVRQCGDTLSLCGDGFPELQNVPNEAHERELLRLGVRSGGDALDRDGML